MTIRASCSAGALVAVTSACGLAMPAVPIGGPSPPHVGRRPTLALRPHVVASATALAPGDRIERVIGVRYRGRGRLAAVIFVAKAQRSSRLDSDRRQGLRASIDRCSVPWTKRRKAGYRCAGKRWSVLATGPVLGARKLKRLSLTPGHTDHLRLTLVLPARAENGLQGLTSKLLYRFTGLAR